MFNSSQYISTTVWPWSHQLGPVMNTMHSLILLWTQSQFLINMKLSSSSVHRLDPFHGYNMMHYFSTSFGPCSRRMMVPLSLFIIWYGTCSCLIYMTLLPSVSFKVCSWWVTTLSHYIVKTYSWWIYNAPFSTLHHSDIFHSLYTPHISMNIIIPLMHLTRPVHGKSDKIS